MSAPAVFQFGLTIKNLAPLCSCLLLAGAATPLPAGETKSLPGPIEELRVLDDFTAESKSVWRFSAGSNSEYGFVAGQNIPGIADSLGQVELRTKDAQDRVAGHNWFSMKRALAAGTITSDAKGIRLVMGSQPAAQWWISVGLHVGNETYGHVFEPNYPSRTMIEQVIPFEEFKSGDRTLSASQAVLTDEIKLDTSVPNARLNLDRITTYRQQQYSSWLTFTSSQPHHNIFQPGERVLVTLGLGGELPQTAKSIRYEVQDFDERVTAKGKVLLDGTGPNRLDLTPAKPGYYELRAYWVDAAGRDIENRSCILAEGSLPAGLATFAVMPRTVAQNIELFKTAGSKAFFGLHGDFHGLADLIGLTWRFDYSL